MKDILEQLYNEGYTHILYDNNDHFISLLLPTLEETETGYTLGTTKHNQKFTFMNEDLEGISITILKGDQVVAVCFKCPLLDTLEYIIHRGDLIVLFDTVDQYEPYKEILELWNIDEGYKDEFIICSCGKIHNIQEPSNYIIDYDNSTILCEQCINSFEEVEHLYINNPKKAVPQWLEITGYTKYNAEPYQNGLHYGDNADPSMIFNQLEPLYSKIVFKLDHSDPYTTNFNVYVADPTNTHLTSWGKELFNCICSVLNPSESEDQQIILNNILDIQKKEPKHFILEQFEINIYIDLEKPLKGYSSHKTENHIIYIEEWTE